MENERGGAGCRCVPSTEPFIELFRTTPTNTVCPNFFVMDHARGCGFTPWCRYCYLRDGTYDARPTAFSDVDRLVAEASAWIARDDHEVFLVNAGNLSDSLAFEGARPVAGALVEAFREAERRGAPHTLLFVTKGAAREAAALLSMPPCANVVVSFSVNAGDAARAHERGAPPPSQRLATARRLKDAGWRIRIRMDPMIHGYDYAEVADAVASLSPERVTLGTLRADPPLVPKLPEDLRAPLCPPEVEGTIWRYAPAMREAMYRAAAERLRGVASLGLCEETPAMWDALGFDRANATCNCNPSYTGVRFDL